MTARFIEAAVSSIHIGSRLRKTDRDRVEVLKATIREKGLLQPVALGENAKGLHLAAGLHRLTAVMELGWTTIPATVRTISDDRETAEIELRYIEVVENLDRKELTALDRANHLAALQEVQQQLNPRRKRGGDKRSDEAKLQKLQFDLDDDLAERVGLSPRAVAFAISIARGIAPDIKARLAGTWLEDHQAQLKLLAEQRPSSRQVDIVDMLLLDPPKAASVGEAMALLDGRPAETTAAPWTRLSGSFARLSKRDQFTFFETHVELVEEWLAARKGEAS